MIKERAEEKLKDATLQRNLSSFCRAFKASWEKAYGKWDFHKLREEVSAVKRPEKERIKRRFEAFKKNAEKHGAKVYQAKDAEDACRYIASVCRKARSNVVVKSKSMTSEEIRLNLYLKREGINAVETDLGEWILQLAQEPPSHMVMPAIHKSREEVAELFRQKLNEEVDPNDIKQMVKIARKHLRKAFFEAKVGITGANMAVAETGTIALLTNEGNGRLVATVPPIHVVLLGYEKLVDSFEDALKILRVLPKSATGQNISTYVSWITPHKETHFVFLDNGRLAFAEHEIYSEALKCIRCGSCANFCPVYEKVGGHVFGHVYVGAVGIILTALFHKSSVSRELLSLCAGCKSCSYYCPAGIPLDRLIDRLSLDLERADFKLKLANRLLLSPGLAQRGAKAASKIKDSLSGFNPKLSHFAGDTIFRDELKSLKTESSSGEKVLFFPGCAVEYIFAEDGVNTIKLLERLGFAPEVPEKPVCCGYPMVRSGDASSATKAALRCVELIKDAEKYRWIITICPTCAFALRELLQNLCRKSPEHFKKAHRLRDKVLTIGQLLEKTDPEIASCERITYHNPCHQLKGLLFSPQKWLSAKLKENFVPLKEPDRCCGFGGSFSIEMQELSDSILEDRIASVIETKAAKIITDCPGCMLHIKYGLSRRGSGMEVEHLSTFVLKNLK